MGRKKVPGGVGQTADQRTVPNNQSARIPDDLDEPRAWERGGPSPNPKGRPMKRWKGPVTQKMERETEIVVGGVPTTMSLRELLDRMVQQQARDEGGRWRKLWNDRKARDEHLQSALGDLERYQRVHGTGVKLQRQQEVRDIVLSLIERIVPGLIDTLRSLQRSGALIETEDGWDRASWVDVPPNPPGRREKPNDVSDA